MTVASTAPCALVAVFARVHAYDGALDVCVRAGVLRAIVDIALRLAAEITEGRRIANLPSAADDVHVAESRRLMFEVATAPTRARLAAVCAALPRHEYARVELASLQVGAPQPAQARPTLTGLNVGGASLHGIDLRGLLVENASWIADLTSARFRGCAFEGSDFSYARFDASTWIQTRATRSSFRDCSFRGVTLCDATFVRCDMSQAQFHVSARSNATFVECDLRGAELGPVLLAHGRFINCRMVSVATSPPHQHSVAPFDEPLFPFAALTPRTPHATEQP